LSSRFEPRPLVAGLFCITFATLVLEVLDSRLLSVLAWYHLSFLAVSVAMLGMAAGAVLVFVSGERRGFLSADALPGLSAAFAIALALSHIVNLTMPFPPVRAVTLPDVAALAAATAVLTTPFVFSGIVVTLALTRTGASIGVLYGADLIGAAAGCLGVIGLLNTTDLTSAVFVTSGVAAIGGWCFARALRRRGRGLIVLALMLLAGGLVNAHVDHPLGVMYPKNRSVWPLLDTVEHAEWNSHSYVMVRRLEQSRAWLWGPGTHAPETPAVVAWAMIDGEAGTPITKWDGDRSALDWVQYDVTALPYRLRHGRAAIIGVGGGRDVLTAIWADSPSITGIEINRTFINLLAGPYRQLAGIADRPGVTLVNDEARAFLTRTHDRFDVLQMSLIDTWASTGAGAFTLTENGLYTREGWEVFLRALTPTGVFSVSRWYAPGTISETTRLVSLGVAALVDAGVAVPSQHLILASAGNVATLMISPAPFSDSDRAALDAAATRFGFDVLVSPWHAAADERIARVTAAGSIDALNRAAADPHFDFLPPTDARPFFFNMLKLRGVVDGVQATAGGIITGNLVATSTILALLGIAVVLVIAIIGAPLAAVGTPDIAPRPFIWGLLYFSLIGSGFMFVQIPFLQRFSVYLGHPTYTFSVILFLMILAAGLGSLMSDRLWRPASAVPARRLQMCALGVAALIVAESLLLQGAMDRTIGWELPARTLVVAVFVGPLACALGFCFPIGMRLVDRHSSRATAWMWGVNGASGVLASIVAVMVSLWLGIQTNLWLAGVMYGLLALPIARLATRRPVDSAASSGG
jgi:spermidine synthase